MQLEPFSLKVGHQKISGELALPDGEKVQGNLVIILAHGLNGDKGMEHPVVKNVHELLARRGFVCVRFNFPFAQNKKKKQDDDKTLLKTYVEVVNWIKAQQPAAIIYGGFSLGSMVAAAAGKKGNPAGLLLLGYPITDGNGTHLKNTITGKVPVLFISGTEDKYTDPMTLGELVDQIREQGTSAEMFYIGNAGHSFHPRDTKQKSWHQNFLEIVEMIDRWISHHWY